MSCRTPESQLTVHISEEGVQKLLDTYRLQRPEEFRVVSKNFVPDGDPNTEPIKLNNKGNELDYAIRLSALEIDMYPPNAGSQSPIPPALDQFEIGARVDFNFRDFPNEANFAFAIDLWVLCELPIVPHDGSVALSIDIKELRISDSVEATMRSLFEHILLLLLRHAVRDIRIPTTAGIAGILKFFVFELDIKDNTTQLFAGVQIGRP